MRVFVAWDFSDPAAKALLEGVARYVESEGRTEWAIPGINNAHGDGVVGSDIVERSVREAHTVVALTDRANANVGWEVGLALGLGKQLRLASIRPNPQLACGALDGVLVTRVACFRDVHSLPQRDGWAWQMSQGQTAEAAAGEAMCVLCPGGPEGSVLQEAIKREGVSGVRLLEPGHAKLALIAHALPTWKHVVWVVAIEANADARDGTENASNAIVAGMARGVGIPVTILHSTRARNLVDLAAEAIPFEGIDDFLSKLRSVLTVARPRRVECLTSAIEFEPSKDRARLAYELQRLFRHRATIIELAASVRVDVLPASATPDQCWGEILRQVSNGHRDVGPLVDAGLEIEPTNPFLLELRFRAPEWLSGSLIGHPIFEAAEI